MGELITTLEAARITRHKTRETFIRWAKRSHPDVLYRPRRSRAYLVDKERLLKYLQDYAPY